MGGLIGLAAGKVALLSKYDLLEPGLDCLLVIKIDARDETRAQGWSSQKATTKRNKVDLR